MEVGGRSENRFERREMVMEVGEARKQVRATRDGAVHVTLSRLLALLKIDEALVEDLSSAISPDNTDLSIYRPKSKSGFAFPPLIT